MVSSGIMAGREIYSAIQFAALNFVGHRRSGCKCLAEQRPNVVLLQNTYREAGKFFGVETRVVAYKNPGLIGFAFDVFGNRGDRKTYACECEIVRDQATPAGSSKLDRRSNHGRVF